MLGLISVVPPFDIESLRRRLLTSDRVLGLEEGHRPDAAVAVIIKTSGSTSSLLLIRRPERRGDPWSGQIAFPGGHRAPSDRSFLETAIRETFEEVGISLGDHTLLGVLPLVYARTRKVKVAPFIFQLKTSVELRLNMEVAEAFWVPVSGLIQSKVVRSTVRVEESEFSVDSYIYGENVIWGLTLRIIRILLGTNGS
jgi:8-oxo-dGTP pyrophosphatase MutT (NUDIX family)